MLAILLASLSIVAGDGRLAWHSDGPVMRGGPVVCDHDGARAGAGLVDRAVTGYSGLEVHMAGA